MKPLKLEDFLNYSYIGSLDSTGEDLLYIKAKSDEKKNSYIRNLYMLKGKEEVQLTSSGTVGRYTVKDGSVYFMDKRSEEEKKDTTSSVIYRLPLKGGEAVQWKKIKGAVSSFHFLPDGKLLLVKGEDLRERGVKEKDLEAFRKKNAAFEEVEEYPMYFNGAGFVSGRTSVLYILGKDGKEKKVFKDDFQVEDVVLTKDGSKAAVVGYDRARKSTLDLYSEIRELDTATGEWKTILEDGKVGVDGMDYIADTLVLASCTYREYGTIEDPNFYTIKDGELKLLKEWRKSAHSSVGSDCRLVGGKGCHAYGDWFYFTPTFGPTSQLWRINLEGTTEPVVAENGSVDDYTVTEGGKTYVIAMRGKNLQEIYDQKGKKLTSINKKALQGKYVADFEPVEFQNDGFALKGWVLKPYGYEEGKKYPAILDIHGGPKTVYGEIFYHEMQYWAGQGYFVMFTNPRGSDGWGEDFADIRGKYGTIDYSDLMKFVDVVLEQYPDIDKERLGETGGSYGGFMSNWILGHTDRFKCIATQRSISNWISFAGTSDIGTIFVDTHCGCPADNYGKLLEHSPIVGINANAKTPTLIIHSDQDYRCPIEQGYQVLAALKRRNVPVRMVVFHGENHELSRGGKPQGRVKRLSEISSWFEKYLK